MKIHRLQTKPVLSRKVNLLEWFSLCKTRHLMQNYRQWTVNQSNERNKLKKMQITVICLKYQ
jgi:hypothetical protein